MTENFRVIDLSRLPPPDVVEPLDYESILAEMLADLRSRAPEYNALVESDPAYKILEVAAYREQLLRQRVNDAARRVMLPYAKGNDLSNLAAAYGVERMLVSPGDPAAIPPVAAVYETDERLLDRVLMAPYAWSCAGSRQGYRYHAMTAHADVADAYPFSPTGGVARIAVLSESGDGIPSDDALAAVLAALSEEDVRPLCDTVMVVPARITSYSVNARIYLDAGPSEEPVYKAVLAAVTAYACPRRRLGRKIALSGFYAALHLSGVARAELITPAADIPCAKDEALHCESVNIVIGDSYA